MKYNELNISTQKNKNRVGRGIAAGQGKTAGRGTKGQNARKSGGVRPGFEGGQNPLMQRLPKLRGFRSRRPITETIYTGQLDELTGTIDSHKLFEAGLISSPYNKVKIVLNGEVTKKHTIKLPAVSAQALLAIKKAGGEFTAVDRAKRAAKKETTK
jgi:large subunit ribosomal protein L15